MSERTTRYANVDRARPAARGNESWVRTGALELVQAGNSYGAPAPSATETQQLAPGERRVKELFRQSFRFSQGDPDLHNKISRWLVVGGHFDGLPVPEIAPPYIDALQPPKKHAEMDDDVQVDVRFAWGHLHWLTNAKQHPPQEQLAAEILEDMADRDLKYATEGRQGRVYKPESAASPSQDPFASCVRNFVLQQQVTGTDAFDQLHAQLHAVAANDLSAQDESTLSPRQEKLRVLQQKWEQHHEGEQFFTPQQAEVSSDLTADQEATEAKPKIYDHTPYASELREGGEEAWATFYTRYNSTFYSAAYRILGNADAAEDAVQSAFIGLYRTIVKNGSDLAGRRVGAYMYKSVHNAAINIIRRDKSAHGKPSRKTEEPDREYIQKRPIEFESTDLPVDASKATDEEVVIGNDYVSKVLDTIPNEDMRVVLELKVKGLNDNEIAAKLGIPRNTVATRLFRARKYARSSLKELVKSEESSESQEKKIPDEPVIGASTQGRIADQEYNGDAPQTVFQRGKTK